MKEKAVKLLSFMGEVKEKAVKLLCFTAMFVGVSWFASIFISIAKRNSGDCGKKWEIENLVLSGDFFCAKEE